MGLDLETLICVVDDAFGISIEEDEAIEARTLGDLRDIVIRKLEIGDSKRCLSSAAFYRVGRAMVEALGIDRRRIGPSTLLEAILPRPDRREQWRRIQAAMTLRLPGLAIPTGTAFGLTLLQYVLSAVCCVMWPLFGVPLVVLFFWMAWRGWDMKIVSSLAVEFPNQAATVGDLARVVLATYSARLTGELGPWNRNDIWDMLRRTIRQEICALPSEVVPETPISHVVTELQ